MQSFQFQVLGEKQKSANIIPSQTGAIHHRPIQSPKELDLELDLDG